MPLQLRADRLDAAKAAGLEATLAESGLHLQADGFPAFRAHQPMDATICDDLDVPDETTDANELLTKVLGAHLIAEEEIRP